MSEPHQPDEMQRPDEPGKIDANLDQSPAEVPPVLMPDSAAHSVLNTVVITVVALVAVVFAAALFIQTMQSGKGATRSAKLKMEERQRLIEQAERNAKSAPTNRG
jgi:hypothetical protein